MSQRWITFCIDSRERAEHLGKLAEAFYSDPHVFEYELVKHRKAEHPAPATPPVAPLERLPSLIKRRICAFLAAVDVDDLLCVILAVPHMAADGQVALNSRMSWAGKRIITLGDRAVNVPQNLLSADERCLLDRGRRSGYALDRDVFDNIRGVYMFKAYPRSDRYSFACIWSRNTGSPYVSIKDLVCQPAPLPENAVLRNLTLKQYYRDSNPCRNRTSGRCRDGKINAKFGLGQVVLIMTCWSNDPSTSFHADWTRSDVRGKWAGHRLDIVASELVSADWEDVTDAVKAKLMRLRDQLE